MLSGAEVPCTVCRVTVHYISKLTLSLPLQTKSPNEGFDTVYDEWLHYQPGPSRRNPEYVCHS